jgi:hypothetical protein
MRGVKRFGMKGKLAPCYIGPFPILGKCEPMAYKRELPSYLARVHDIFHVSQLKRCLKAPGNVVSSEVASLGEDLTYLEHPIKILDQIDHVPRRKMVKFFKVQWSNHTEEEPTWGNEEVFRSCHPKFELP